MVNYSLPRPTSTQYIYIAPISIFFYMIVLAASVAGQKLISVFGVIISAGTLIFPISYMVIACMTEVYGLKKTRQVIFTCGFCNLFVGGYLFLVVKIPPAHFWMNQNTFSQTTIMTSSILLASTAAFIASEYVNAKAIAKLKILLQGKWLPIRAATSTGIAAVVDSTLMLPIIFYNSRSVGLKIYFSLIAVKILYEIMLLPFLWVAVEFLKQKEEIHEHNNKDPFTSVSYPLEDLEN